LIDLIPRIYDPQEGEILIDGVPIREIPLDELRRTIGMVPQESLLFSDTISSNLVYGDTEEMPDEDAGRWAAQIAQLEETITSFPSGYDTMLGERGINLPGARRSSCSMMRSRRSIHIRRRPSCMPCGMRSPSERRSSRRTGSARSATRAGSSSSTKVVSSSKAATGTCSPSAGGTGHCSAGSSWSKRSKARPDRVARVLVVEDNGDAGDAMRMLLESGGHDVRVVRTVADAIAACNERPIDLMLLDLTLPDGDGLEVLAQATPPPNVTLALTGWDEPAIIERCRAAGCRDVLLKPVSARTLLALAASHSS
jgi:CheY-like chemotaxis protein